MYLLQQPNAQQNSWVCRASSTTAQLREVSGSNTTADVCLLVEISAKGQFSVVCTPNCSLKWVLLRWFLFKTHTRYIITHQLLPVTALEEFLF